MADTLNKIEVVSPELATLIRKVKAIYVVTGGKQRQSSSKDTKGGFDMKKVAIMTHIDNIDRLVETRDTSNYEPDSRDLIRLKNQIRIEMKSLETGAAELQQEHSKDMNKRKKPSQEELAERAAFFNTLQKEMARITERVSGRKSAFPAAGAGAGAGGAGARVVTTEELMSGGPIPALNVRQERISEEQRAQLALIHEQTAEQDNLLDQISMSLEGLQKAAHAIHDEVQLQNELIDDTLEKVDETAAQLDGVNDRVKDALKKVNSKSATFCVYVICFVLLAGLLTVLYNMIK